ncbi:MAG: DUF302 domain-containing protein [Desulfobacterales bacterium]
MTRLLISVFILFGLVATTGAVDNGLVNVKSPHTVKETADRLEQAIKAKGMTVFIRIDHAAGAQKAGLSLPPTEVVIFGNPKVGTPLMQCSRSAAIDLPQKALIWEDEKGQVWLTYNDPAYLAARHAISGCEAVLEKIGGALHNFAAAATQP